MLVSILDHSLHIAKAYYHRYPTCEITLLLKRGTAKHSSSKRKNKNLSLLPAPDKLLNMQFAYEVLLLVRLLAKHCKDIGYTV